MACISSTKKADLEAQLAKINTFIASVETAYNDSLSTEIESYTFDSAEARQQAKLRDPDKLFEQLEKLYTRRDYIIRRLNGTGIVNMNLRRINYGC